MVSAADEVAFGGDSLITGNCKHEQPGLRWMSELMPKSNAIITSLIKTYGANVREWGTGITYSSNSDPRDENKDENGTQRISGRLRIYSASTPF